MKTTLTFTVSIQAPRKLVWEQMIDPEGYKIWTTAFCEGSYFEGSWKKGEKIQFMAPGGDGMASEIAENRLHEYISIRHIGEVRAGVVDTTSPAVLAWAPAYENYTFVDAKGGTDVTITLDTLSEYEKFMLETCPKALDLLKTLCESKAGSGR